MRPFSTFVALVFSLAPLSLAVAQFANFESPQAHSILVSKDGNRLFAINTPNRELAVFSIADANAPKLEFTVPVGLEPVSLAARSEKEVWVVNHLSNSISVVDLNRKIVIETIPTADAPGDIVFDSESKLAFVSSMKERLVQVFNCSTKKLVKTIPIRGNDPRTLLASKDGKKVWVAVFRSGNKTTIIPHHIAPPPPKPTNGELPPAPKQGIIVRTDDPTWEKQIDFELADEDIFEINTDELKVQRAFKSTGTINFNFAESPTGHLWIANIESLNQNRFEPNLKGHVADNRVTQVSFANENPKAKYIDLNPDVDYKKLPNPESLETAIAQPTDIIFDEKNQRAFVSSFGTDRIAILNFAGAITGRIEVGDGETRTMRGPRALALHPDAKTLYVLNRLSNSVSVIDTEKNAVQTELDLTDPTPQEIKEGRGYLFDARLSGNGTASCATCHIDGDRDGLAWDLGDPNGKMFNSGSNKLHPMKGPLLTQTLRGLAGERIFHWRADRPGLESFNGTFANLLGGKELDEDDMDTFAIYMKSIRFRPNRTVMNELAKRGKEIFQHRLNIGKQDKNTFRCIDCHTKPSGAGTSGFTGLIAQPTKAAQLRGLSQRTVFAPDKSRINGFGFGADGSKPDLLTFLSDTHRFSKINLEDKQALQDFLFSFPTETPSIVGTNFTLLKDNLKGLDIDREQLQKLIAASKQGICELTATGMLKGQIVNLKLDSKSSSFKSNDGKSNYTANQILDALPNHKTIITFLASASIEP